MKLATKDCVTAIVDYVNQNPGHVYKQFVGEPGTVDDFEAPARKVSNWKRMSKEKMGDTIVREFDCRPYDDQLRAIVEERDGKIVSVVVQGE
jgi:hypothetical protein